MSNLLYALCDMDMLKKADISLNEYVDIANSNGAVILQYRNKSGNHDDKLQDLKNIVKHFNGKVIVNDDISLSKYCDGLHIGQDDILHFHEDKKEAIKIIRDRIGNKMLGLSTHNKKEVKESNALELDYIGLGAYKSSSTKRVDSILGEELSVIAFFSLHDVAAIGGVKKDDRIKNVKYNVVGSGLL